MKRMAVKIEELEAALRRIAYSTDRDGMPKRMTAYQLRAIAREALDLPALKAKEDWT